MTRCGCDKDLGYCGWSLGAQVAVYVTALLVFIQSMNDLLGRSSGPVERVPVVVIEPNPEMALRASSLYTFIQTEDGWVYYKTRLGPAPGTKFTTDLVGWRER